MQEMFRRVLGRNTLEPRKMREKNTKPNDERDTRASVVRHGYESMTVRGLGIKC